MSKSKKIHLQESEDIDDLRTIKGIKEGKRADYLTADKLDSLFEG